MKKLILIWFLSYIALFLSYSISHAQGSLFDMNQAVVAKKNDVVCTTASANSNILFFWRAQAADFSGTNNSSAPCTGSGTGEDCSAGDETGSLLGGAAIDTDAALGNNGTNGLDIPTASDYISFTTNIDSIFDGAELRAGFLFYSNATPGGAARAFTLRTGEGATDEFIIWYDASDHMYLAWENSGDSTQTSGTVTISTDTALWIEVAASAANDYLKIYVYNYATGALLDSVETTGLTMNDIGTPSLMYVGNSVAQTTDYYQDLVIISSDPATSLLEYRDDTSYISCN